jgi:1,4-alpha-glucan branching enzyme
MALDKFYGSSELKEMIDVCHQNGIVVNLMLL